MVLMKDKIFVGFLWIWVGIWPDLMPQLRLVVSHDCTEFIFRHANLPCLQIELRFKPAEHAESHVCILTIIVTLYIII